jgi:hypothetical protein
MVRVVNQGTIEPGHKYFTYMLDSGLVKVFGVEGVTRVISPDGFFTGDYLDEDTKITYRDLMQSWLNGTEVDLADAVRTFGDRLEANFGLIYRDITGKGPSHE